VNQCIDCKWCDRGRPHGIFVQQFNDACKNTAAYRGNDCLWFKNGYYMRCSYMRKRYGEDCPYFAEIPPRKWWQIWRKK